MISDELANKLLQDAQEARRKYPAQKIYWDGYIKACHQLMNPSWDDEI